MTLWYPRMFEQLEKMRDSEQAAKMSAIKYGN